MRQKKPVFGSCTLCRSPLAVKYPRVMDAQTYETFSILNCPHCGLGTTAPQPIDISQYYGMQYYGGRHGFTARYCIWRRLRYVKKLLGVGKGRRLLDIGCGDGSFLQAAAKHQWHVFGLEINPDPAQKKGLDVRKEMTDFSRDAPFHCITLWHSLEHLRDPRTTIHRASSLLSPDGTIFISVPNAKGFQARIFGKHWLHLDVPRHLFHFGERSLRTLLKQEGFNVVARWHQEFELDLFGWVQSALNVLFSKPNTFFYLLTGRRMVQSRFEKMTQYLLGALFTVIFTPAVFISTLLKNGGILVIAAKKERAMHEEFT